MLSRTIWRLALALRVPTEEAIQPNSRLDETLRYHDSYFLATRCCEDELIFGWHERLF